MVRRHSNIDRLWHFGTWSNVTIIITFIMQISVLYFKMAKKLVKVLWLDFPPKCANHGIGNTESPMK